MYICRYAWEWSGVMMLRRNISDWMERKERGKRCGFVARHVTIGTCCKRAIRIVTEGMRERALQRRYMYMGGVLGTLGQYSMLIVRPT